MAMKGDALLTPFSLVNVSLAYGAVATTALGHFLCPKAYFIRRLYRHP